MRAQNTILSYMLCLLAALTPIIAALSPVIAALSPVSVIPSPFSAALSPVPDTLTPVPDTRTPVPDTLTPAPAALSLAPAALSPALENGEVIIVSPPAAPLPPTDEILVVLDDSDTDDSDSGDSDSEFEETVVLGSSFFAPSLAELLTPAVSAARVSPLSTGEATRICRSPAWALTPENWIFSGAKEYLEAYTAATEGAYARKKFGLVGSLAYHYLGEENFRCDIGSKTCAVSCKDVAMAVEDLEEAQLVYFVLSSVSHFAAVANLVHDALAIGQNNVGLMAPKMAFSFFWRPEANTDNFQFMLQLTITGVQQVFQFLSPFVPFVKVLDDLQAKLLAFPADLERRIEMEHISWLFARTARMFNAYSAHQFSGTFRSQQEPQQELGFYERITGFRGDRTRYSNTQDKRWWLYGGRNVATETQPDGRAWKGGNNLFDRYLREGWRRRVGEFSEREGVRPIPPSHAEYSGNAGGFLQEQNWKYNALVAWREDADRRMSSVKTNVARMGLSLLTGWFPQIFMGVNSFFAWGDNENGQDVNAAYLAMQIQESSRQARGDLRKSFENLMDPSTMSPDGETLLSNAIGFGHYLPPNDNMLKAFTAYDIEDKITKNIFHKALNAALKAQHVYITCTPDLQRREKPHYKSGQEASGCKRDNTGPADLKACVTTTAEQSRARGFGDEPVELACYMYKWSSRGIVLGHHNERPFGSDSWEEEWGVSPQDIITSSVKGHLAGPGNASPTVNMESRQSPDDLANPSTAGVFTVPVCISRHNWNSGIRDFSHFDKLNPWSSKKNLPCSCGFWGDETEQVWRDMGIWDINPSYYRKDLCPAQRRRHMTDPLEKYVNECRLDTRKSGLIRKIGRDGLCDIVMATLEVLRAQGINEELPKDIRDLIWCRVQNGLFPDSACEGVPVDTPFSKILEELDDRVYVRKNAELEAIEKLKAEAAADELFLIGLELEEIFGPPPEVHGGFDVEKNLLEESLEEELLEKEGSFLERSLEEYP